MLTQEVTRHRRMQEQPCTEEERLRLAVEAGGVGTFEENLQTGKLIRNRQCLDLLGLRSNEPASAEAFFSIVHPDDRPHLRLTRRHLLDTPGDCEFEVEYRIIRPHDGTLRWMESRGKVIESPTQPGRRRLLGVVHDSTKRHEAEEFRKLSAGVIAHDLRSPLSAIKLSSQMLIRGEALPEAAVQKLQGIVGKVDRMAHMVEQYLLYTQAQFGGLQLDRERTDLEEVCRNALDDARATNPPCEVHLEAHGDCRGIWDPTRLTQVVANLVGNAIKHGQMGWPVHVVVRDEGDGVELQVHNTGLPIAPELLPVIFEPFRRCAMQEQTRKGSFGLGLYITREIVAAHDGFIEVHSSASAGTTFTVRLPRGPRLQATSTSKALT